MDDIMMIWHDMNVFQTEQAVVIGDDDDGWYMVV